METVVFAEMPYVYALDDCYLGSHCAGCFQETTEKCPKGCGGNNYCSAACATNDWQWHQHECAAWKQFGGVDKARMVCSLRLVVRYATRMLVDKGKAKLSVGFPKFAKERTCGDLLTHYREMKKDPKRKESLTALWMLFVDRFGQSPLNVFTKKQIQSFHSLICINTFGMLEQYNNATTSPRLLGVGLYVNASRFNHDCHPSLFVRFNGLRMYVERYPGRCPKIRNERELNRQTVDYGTPSDASFGCFIPTAEQRITSLRERYYFRCRCNWCGNDESAKIENNASAYTCDICQKPFVWRRKCKVLKQTCRCKIVNKPKVTEAMTNDALTLSAKWVELMNKTHENTVAMINYAEEVWLLARDLWHAQLNMRFTQLCDLLYRSYKKLRPGQDHDAHKRAVFFGEHMVTGYNSRSEYEWRTAGLWLELAQFCKQIPDEEYQKKATVWLESIAALYDRFGDDTDADLVKGILHQNEPKSESLPETEPLTETETTRIESEPKAIECSAA